MWEEIAIALRQKINPKFEINKTMAVGGGCINQAYQIVGNTGQYFIKLNAVNKVDMFRVEAIALQQMHETTTIKVPQPIHVGTTNNHSYIILEWLNLGRQSNQSWHLMGKNLAQLHQGKNITQFGWNDNNTIGSTPQINHWMDNWANFFAEQRIGYQLKLARRKGANFGDSTNIVEAIREKLTPRKPKPSLVHGDLWSGNAAFLDNGEPIIFDPAAYYGDREVDIAMTELFGGFPSSFYEGYNQQWPLDLGYTQRKTIYNLYHILNHYNLFGGGYSSQAQMMIDQII